MNNLIVTKTKQYIYENMDKNISTKDICLYLDISSTYLIKCFKIKTGITPHNFILNLKVAKAKELLDNGDDICKVALDVGFCDQSHLNRVFKRCEDVTPYEYKKSLKQ